MRILIIEDESLSAAKLERLITKFTPQHQVVGTCRSVKESIEWLTANHCDLILLDIQLSDGLSFDIFNHVSTTAKIVITSAYEQYAIAAYKIGSVDYLLKPIEDKEFIETMQRIDDSPEQSLSRSKTISSTPKPLKSNYKKRFTVRLGDKILIIDTADIALFVAEDKLTVIVTTTGKRYLSETTLASIEQMVDPQLFFRITRSSIVNIATIGSVTKSLGGRLKIHLSDQIVKAINDSALTLSRNRAQEFMSWIEGDHII